MPSKTFTTRRYWNNTLLVVWVTPFLALVGVLLLAVYGSFVGLIGAGAFFVIGMTIALVRDSGDGCSYTFKAGRLVLENRNSKKEIPVGELIDASLVDRSAAREYIKEKAAGKAVDAQARKAAIAEMVRYCSVDIGLTTLTFGLGRAITDRLPISRHDLVLLRTKLGDHLLSPRYDQDMVETVGRVISARPD